MRSEMSNLPTLPNGVTLAELVRMPALEIIVTYGRDVYDVVSYLEGAGLIARDGRSNADLALQAQMRQKLAEEGDCEPADSYRAEAMALAEQSMKQETKDG
jgi:hypothetical protein